MDVGADLRGDVLDFTARVVQVQALATGVAQDGVGLVHDCHLELRDRGRGELVDDGLVVDPEDTPVLALLVKPEGDVREEDDLAQPGGHSKTGGRC